MVLQVDALLSFWFVSILFLDLMEKTCENQISSLATDSKLDLGLDFD